MTQTLKSETRDDLSTFGTLLLHMFHSSSTSESNPFSNTLFVQVRVPLCSAAAAVLPSPSVIHQIGCGSNYLFAHWQHSLLVHWISFRCGGKTRIESVSLITLWPQFNQRKSPDMRKQKESEAVFCSRLPSLFPLQQSGNVDPIT